MKYGLLTFKNTENIGDDIQSYAAIRFLPKIDYYIEREKLDLFLPKEKKQVVTIMNGWFLHSKINFPLSPFIYPIFLSTHFSAYNSGGIESEYLNDYSSIYLNKYAPIGCRDRGTMKLLKKCNVENYFSGCLTLTIQKDKKIKKQNHICIVDIDELAESYLRNNVNGIKIIKRTHVLDMENNSKLSWDERFNNVKSLLDVYQSSKLVITSRLHCALPCLALGTPVLLLYDENKEFVKDRLSDYSKILNHITTDEFLKKGIDIINSGFENPDNFLRISKLVEKKVKNMLAESKENISSDLPTLQNYQKLYIEPKKNLDNLYNVSINNMYIKKRDYTNLLYERDYWKKEYENAVKIMEKEKQDITFKIDNLQKELLLIKNSKSWKILEKIRNILNNE